MIYVAEASGYARRLVEDEAHRNGQPIKVAARTVARRLRTSPSSIWSLLFRPPKQISASLLFALQAAVERQIVREIEALNNELVSLRQKGRRVDPGTLEEIETDIARLRARLNGERAQ